MDWLKDHEFIASWAVALFAFLAFIPVIINWKNQKPSAPSSKWWFRKELWFSKEMLPYLILGVFSVLAFLIICVLTVFSVGSPEVRVLVDFGLALVISLLLWLAARDE
jgi:hypothetical protein